MLAWLFLSIPIFAQELFQDVYDILQSKQDISIEVEQNAIQSMLQTFDRENGLQGSQLLSVAEYTKYKEYQKGWREGYGLRVQLIPGKGFLVEGVIEGSYAMSAGVQSGDIVVALHNTSLMGLESNAMLEVLYKDVRGETPIVVLRNGQQYQYSLQKSTFHMQQVSMNDVISLHFFGEGVSKDVASIFQMHPNITKVIDLRDCEGGLWEEAFASLELFLSEGQILGYRKHVDGTSIPVISRNASMISEPIVILVNKGTKGPAELFALVLQEYNRAVIVGERTEGFAADFTPTYTQSNDVLLLADTEILSAKKQSWNNIGVVPNMSISMNLYVPSYTGTRVDPQLQTALQLISTP
jgi:carboxyl-terminal processing protease